MVFIHVIRGRPSGLLQFPAGEAVKICFASTATTATIINATIHCMTKIIASCTAATTTMMMKTATVQLQQLLLQRLAPPPLLLILLKVKSSTCYSTSYMRQTRGQKRFDNFERGRWQVGCMLA